MAELEVINHAKKALKVWNDKNRSFWHKLKEFVIEILIIVFAITLSIWFHNWSEHRQEQAQVKVFLLGLKKDITADINDTENILEVQKDFDSGYRYLSSLTKDRKPNMDSLRMNIPLIARNYNLRLHQSRFNSFLSAGKIMTIENDSLSFAILTYYQEIIPMMQTSERGWHDLQLHLFNYYLDNVKDFDDDMAIWEVLTTPKCRYITKSLITWPQLSERYENIKTEGSKIIATIDKLYPEGN